MESSEVEAIKQAIREVLLSDEFLKAFAVATSSKLQQSCEPAKAPLNSDNIPEGYRKLGDSLVEQRQLGDLRWSIVEQGYIPISEAEVLSANRDNWAACRKIEATVEATVEAKPPDGWRFLENGEILRRGDKRYKDFVFWDVEAQYIGVNASEAFDTKFIRRNRFKVGEKVVRKDRDEIWEVSLIVNGAYQLKSGSVFTGSFPEHLAPYIEDTK